MCVFQCQPTVLLCAGIDGVECGLFLNHAPLGQITLRVGLVSIQVVREISAMFLTVVGDG